MNSSKNFKNRQDIVYSTNPDFQYTFENNTGQDTLPPRQQNLKVWLETKNRGGKTATVIKNFIGTENDLETLAKALKSRCGTGGSAKNGEIIIQGDFRDKIIDILKSMNYNAKKAGA